MEIVDGGEKMLCNYEVLKILKQVKETTKHKQSNANKNLATITYETINYLDGLKLYDHMEDQHVINYLEAMKEFRLTKLEKLQILNQRPLSVVELQVLIEEAEERFNDNGMEKMLEILETTLPKMDENQEETCLKMEVFDGEE